MFALPAAMPVTIPETASTEATDGLLLAHAPPPVASLNVIEVVGQSVELLVMAPGAAVTVTIAVVIQVLLPVKVTVAVPPLTPYTRPDGLIVAVPTGLMLHAPLVVASDKKLIPVVQTPSVPSIGVGNAFTTTP